MKIQLKKLNASLNIFQNGSVSIFSMRTVHYVYDCQADCGGGSKLDSLKCEICGGIAEEYELFFIS